MARGSSSIPKLPDLATQLMQGAANAQQDAIKEVNKREKRAITMDMLTLFENAIARKENWSDFEKSLRFTVCLLAWWGSFRLGELLGSRTTVFHCSSSLLASDLRFHEGSVSVWLRSPKVSNEPTGDVVEVWAVDEMPELDPLRALHSYLQLRKNIFGDAPDYPLFLHENGSIFTKQHMNADLRDFLSVYPQLNTDVDKWTGHCFRSGISTLLRTLGYKAGCVWDFN